jgi:transposase-like protein
MAYRYIDPQVKVAAIKECLHLNNVSEAAQKYGIDPDTIRNVFKEKIISRLTGLVANEKPGPKPEGKMVEKASRGKDFQKSLDERRPSGCPQCGSAKVWKNGTYIVVNWLVFLICFCIPGVKTVIQRYICGECGCPIQSMKQKIIAFARKRGNLIIHRLVAFAKFKLRLSNRLTQSLVDFLYGIRVSTGYIDRLAQGVGDKARKVMEKLGQCRQRVANIMLGDETFPKVIGKGKACAKSVAVVICEHGLIRVVKAVERKGKNLKQIFKGALGKYYSPLYFLSDYDKKYTKLIGLISENIRQLKDVVHTLQIIHRAFEKAIREIKIDFPKGLCQAGRKSQIKLKQRLLRKRLLPIKLHFFKAFAKGYEPVAHIYIEGALDELEKFPFQNESIKGLTKTLKKFFKKYQDILCFQLEHKEEIITTTNSLESKNSILKPFSKQAKSYQKGETCEKAMNAVALMENFDVKERGKNKGTSAIQRAEINLDDLGAKDFFEAVGLAI